ncbi:MAG: phosphotransferase [Bacteroidetes bacterium]|jgi:5-methylthioribose kinase|nr:phosphotransferase [Bacteroidota bacterium]
MTDPEAAAYVDAEVEGTTVTGRPQRLLGGNLNEVWRVPAEPQPVIVKYAPPHIATNPDVPLAPERSQLEARALRMLGPGGAWHQLTDAALRPPQLLHARADPYVVTMEDVGDVQDLAEHLRAVGTTVREATALGDRLGRFIGRLHRETCGEAELAARLHNLPMQETRHAVQYAPAADFLAKADVPDAETLGSRAEALGKRLQQSGRCWVMGDLWPASILVAPAGLRLIDWELTHFGQPAQDVGHLAAHLWMQAHRVDDAAERFRACGQAFVEGYRASVPTALLTDAVLRDCGLHFGCEILARTTGAFQARYVYEGLASDHPALQEAVHKAAAALRAPLGTALVQALAA